MLRLLKIFDEICARHDLTYWLCGGTLLGAVRHGGFIPWDDDVDVEMPYEDYLKFAALDDSEFPADVFFQNEKTDIDYICPFMKIRDRFSFIEEGGGPYPYSQAAYIDIFPICKLTPRQLKYRSWYAFLPPYSIKPERIVKHLAIKSKARILVQGTIQRFFILLNKIPYIQKAFIHFFEKDKNTEKEKYQDLYPMRFDEIFDKDIFFPLEKLCFEDGEFNVPNNYDKYLTTMYGNYMVLPPVEKRCSDHAVTSLSPLGPNPHFSALNWPDFYNEDGTPKE
jgi:lipopolysaccharide cholinephosphotransferase